MIFQNPSALLILVIVPPLAIFLIWRLRAYRDMLAQLGDWTLIRQLISRYDPRWRYWQSGLWLITLIVLIVALARPSWGVNTEVIELQGVSVVIVLDVSNSMASQDILPSRLDQAKLALHDLMDGLGGNEIGLVLFAGSAFVQFPLTTDSSTAQTFLEAVNTRSITQQGTAIETALTVALDLFDEQSPAAPIIVLATDGEDHEGSLDQVVNTAIQRGIVIHALGYGAVDGAPVPVLSDDGDMVAFKTNSAGEMVVSRLDEITLQQIADQTGGTYQRAGSSGREITQLIQIIQAAETGLLDTRLESRHIERFGLFVLVGIIALTFEMLAAPSRNKVSS